MKSKVIIGILLTVLLIGMLTSAFNIHASGGATTVAAGWRAFSDIYGNIITFVNESIYATEWTLMYYNISTGTVTNTGVSVYDPFLLWHSIYDNLIASPGPYMLGGIGLYNISAGNVTQLPSLSTRFLGFAYLG